MSPDAVIEADELRKVMRQEMKKLPERERTVLVLYYEENLTLGEIGDDNGAALMAAYTAGGRRLHMAYSFALLTDDHRAERIRHEVEVLEAAMHRTKGWPCWALCSAHPAPWPMPTTSPTAHPT